MSASVLIDGREASALDVRDRATQYGDGVFETLAVRAGRVRLLEHHLERLEHGCARLGFTAPRPEAARGDLARLTAGQTRAVLKLVVSRGAGGRGYRPPQKPRPRRIALRYPWPRHLAAACQRGLRLVVCRTRLATPSVLAGIKHLNRLEQVLARNEWESGAGLDEGLMLDGDDHVIEATAANVFIVRDGELATPDLSAAGVAGVMRRAVLETAGELEIPVRETALGLADVEHADEVFLTNAVMGVAHVASLGERRWPHGPVTRRLAEAVAVL